MPITFDDDEAWLLLHAAAEAWQHEGGLLPNEADKPVRKLYKYCEDLDPVRARMVEHVLTKAPKEIKP